MDWPTIGILATLLSTAVVGGVAWGGARAGARKELNGTKARVERIEKSLDADERGQRLEDKLDHLIEQFASARERIATIEGFCPFCRSRFQPEEEEV
jgi:hypothetical protein